MIRKVSFCFLFFVLVAMSQYGFGQAIDSTKIQVISGKKYLMHQVEKGNTLYSLSRRYQVSVDDLVKENPSAKAGLNLGQILRIPLPDRRDEEKRKIELDGNYIAHEVIAKQTLFSISKIYNVEVKDIMVENQNAVYGIHEGDILKIPIKKIKKNKAVKRDVTKDLYLDHVVLPKETLFSLSKFYGVSIDEIKRVNYGLKEGLKVGEVINLPLEKNAPQTAISIQPEDSVQLKNHYKIAVFLPFFLDINDSLETNRIGDEEVRLYGGKNTAAALKFYQGVLLALDSAKQKGFNATVYIYDTENKVDKIESVLQKPEFKKMDLIIGPLYKKTFKVVAEFAKREHVSIISPVNPSNRVLLGNPYVIKVVTSKTTQTNGLSKYVAEHYKADHIMVINEEYKTNNLSKVFQESYKEYLDLLANDSSSTTPASEYNWNSNSLKTDDLKRALKADQKNVIFVPSTNRVLVTNVMRKLNSLVKDFDITVIGMDGWLKYDNIDIDYFNRLRLHVFTWNHIDYESPDVVSFAKKYEERYESYPDDYAIRGFDTGLYSFTLLKKYGKNFQKYMEVSPMEMTTLSFKFCRTGIESGFENQTFTILKYEDFELVPAN